MGARVTGQFGWAPRAAVIVGALVVGLFGLSVPVMFDRLETVCAAPLCHDVSLSEIRFEPPAEAAVYFCCLEACRTEPSTPPAPPPVCIWNWTGAG